MAENYSKQWEESLKFIKDNVGESRFNTWFAIARLESFVNNTLTIKLPSSFYFEKYEDDFYNVIRAAITKNFGKGVEIMYVFPTIKDDNAADVSLPSPKKSHLLKNKYETLNFQKPAIVNNEVKQETAFDPQLNPALNFENYCVGESNKLAFTIADYIANHPKNSNFNPFFLYGDVGVGKTHLIQAIGIKIKEQNPQAKVFFTTSKQFQTAYAKAAMTKKIPNFINWFSDIDVLLLDDLQEIANKIKTSNEALFPIFNHLHQKGHQLIFTSDRPPMELDGMTDRLIDRFKWGITEKLPRPDAELRKKILTFKARNNGLSIPEDVIDYIASKATTSVRELEGVVMGILTRSITLNQPITLELAKEVLKNSVKTQVKKTINFDMIVEATAEFYKLNPDVIFSQSRVRDIADARQVIMYLCNKLTGLSSVSIGMKLKRSHATVLHGISAIKDRVDTSEDFAASLSEIERCL